MEGIGLDNMLGAEEVERMFSDNVGQEEETNSEAKAGEETPASEKDNETEETGRHQSQIKALVLHKQISSLPLPRQLETKVFSLTFLMKN